MVVAVYCDSCGVKIAPDALEGGQALQFEDSFYCRDCKADILPLIGKTPAKAKPKSPAKTSRKKASADKTAAAPVKRKRRRSASASGDEVSAASAKKPAAPKRRRRSASSEAPAASDEKKAAPKRRRRSTSSEAAAAPKEKPSAGVPTAADEAALAYPTRKRRRATAAKPEEQEAAPKRRKAARAGTAAGSRRPQEQGERKSPAAPKPGAASRPKRTRRRSQESSTGDGEPRTPRRAKTAADQKPLLIGLGVVGGILLLAIGAFMMGGDKGPKPLTPAQIAQKKKAEAAATTQRRKKVLVATEEKAKRYGEDYVAMIDLWRSVTEELGGDYADQIKTTIAGLEQTMKIDAQTAFDRISSKADDLTADGKYVEALAEWNTFPYTLRTTTVWLDKGKTAVQVLEKIAIAQSEAEPLLNRATELAAQGEYQRALGVLEGFDTDHYADSTWTQKMEELKRAYAGGSSDSEQQAALEALAAERAAAIARKNQELADKKRQDFARIAAMPWDNQGVDLLIWRLPEPRPKEAWTTEGDELRGKAPGANLEGMANVAAVAGVGDPEWQDFVIEFEYKVISGSFHIGARSTPGAWAQLEPQISKDGSWHKYTFLAYGKDSTAFQEISSLSPLRSKPIKFDAHDSLQGGVAFVLPASAEVHFRNIRAKVINKAR